MIQTKKLKPFPVYLVGGEFWRGMVDWLKNTLVKVGTISAADLDLFKVVDDVTLIPEEIVHYYRDADHAGFKVPQEDPEVAAKSGM